MLNRKLVKQLFYSFGLLMVTAGLLSATPLKPSDSLSRPLASPDATHFAADFFTTPISFPAGYYWQLPALPANKQRDTYVVNYIARNAELLEKMRERSPQYFRVMDSVFTVYGLPRSLRYLAIVESELNTRALSRVGARGTWQLMPETARILKLRVNGVVDERTHLLKSTVAAAKYLRDLYRLFDDWPLTIAAYNCGPGPVYKAIRLSGSRNFWKLQHLLPGETRGHVKKFIGTHYFFEGNGSITTLTKSERTQYNRLLQAFVAEHNLLLHKGRANDTSESEPDGEPANETSHVVRSNAELHRGHEQQEIVTIFVEE